MTSTAIPAERRPVKAVFEAYINAWQERDPSVIAALHSEDGVFHLHMGTPPAVGRPAIQETVTALFAEYRDFQSRPVRLRLGADHWVFEWTLTASTQHGDCTPTEVDCVEIVELSPEGLVARKDVYLDVAQGAALATA